MKSYFVVMRQAGTREPYQCHHQHRSRRSAKKCEEKYDELFKNVRPYDSKSWIEKVKEP